MATWDPVLYRRFANHRLRPAVDLLANVPLAAAATIYDLGCGDATVTRLLVERWPRARIVGVDSSPTMLAAARAAAPAVNFVEADLTDWHPPQPADVLFSNAALQWVEASLALLRRLAGLLSPGGVLAVQMPRNHLAPSHRLIVETVEAGGWRDRLRPLVRPFPVAPAAVQFRNLADRVAAVDVWETEYMHVLEGDNPVVEWTKGTGLRAILDVLHGTERADFLAAYASRLAAAYPRDEAGRTLFPFRRLFLVATAAK